MMHVLRVILAVWLMFSSAIAYAYIPSRSLPSPETSVSSPSSQAPSAPRIRPIFVEADALVTRAHAVAMVVSSVYEQQDLDTCYYAISPTFPPTFTLLFSDVSIQHSYARHLCVALRDGLIHGYADGSFHPDDIISFDEAATLVSRAYTLAPFAHLDTQAPWYAAHVFQLASRAAIPAEVEGLHSLVHGAALAEILERLQENITWRPARSYEDILLNRKATQHTEPASSSASSVSSASSTRFHSSRTSSSAVSSATSETHTSVSSRLSPASIFSVSSAASMTSMSSIQSASSDTDASSAAPTMQSASSTSSDAWWEQY